MLYASHQDQDRPLHSLCLADHIHEWERPSRGVLWQPIYHIRTGSHSCVKHLRYSKRHDEKFRKIQHCDSKNCSFIYHPTHPSNNQGSTEGKIPCTNSSSVVIVVCKHNILKGRILSAYINHKFWTEKGKSYIDELMCNTALLARNRFIILSRSTV
jgi:hypothetical protein